MQRPWWWYVLGSEQVGVWPVRHVPSWKAPLRHRGMSSFKQWPFPSNRASESVQVGFASLTHRPFSGRSFPGHSKGFVETHRPPIRVVSSGHEGSLSDLHRLFLSGLYPWGQDGFSVETHFPSSRLEGGRQWAARGLSLHLSPTVLHPSRHFKSAVRWDEQATPSQTEPFGQHCVVFAVGLEERS